jgi:hypothetical protein
MTNYKVQTETIGESKQINSNCNAIEFVNPGDTDANVDGRDLPAGESFSYYGLKDEMDTSSYNVVFTGTPGTDQRVIVVRKIYVK